MNESQSNQTETRLDKTPYEKRCGTFVSAATAGNAPVVPGRRDFFTYRDLRVVDASAGRMKAHITASVKTMTRPTGWHYHVCESQFAYVLQGWVDLTFEDGKQLRLSAGESLYIPGGVKHNETAVSSDFKVLEVCVPADFGTQPCGAPEGL